MAERNTDRVRYRYGICLNDNCEKCKSKEVQEIPARKDFVCQNPECGKPLRECPPPKKGGNIKLVAIIAGVIVILAIIGCIIAFSGSGSEMPKQDQDSIAVVPVDSDSIKAAQMAAENQRLKDSLAAVEAANAEKKQETEKKADPAPSPKPAPTGGTKNLGYATFKGSWPNDVNGRMIFKESHVIDSKDPKKRMAEAGDYVIGEWADGHLVQGIWYGADNQVKGSVIIGR